MKANLRILFCDDNNEKFFGEGPCRLLHEVERTGSLNAAAASQRMAYTKALKLLKQAETGLGFPLTRRTTGGRSGGGSVLTDEGKAFLEKYEAYRDACKREGKRLYEEYFSDCGKEPVYTDIACVIMASGLGKRFGSNKLLADFDGRPMIHRILDATDDLFGKRIVVTRHPEVEAICRERDIDVILHDFPGRNDTVRLGIEAIPANIKSCNFCPADQPLLTRETIQKLAEASDREADRIWRLAYGKWSGTPAAFPRWTFEELMSLPEGKGGGVLFSKYPEKLSLLQAAAVQELMDADTPEDFAKLQAIGGFLQEGGDEPCP